MSGNIEISELPLVVAPTTDMMVPVVQGNATMRTTSGAIAGLAPAGPRGNGVVNAVTLADGTGVTVTLNVPGAVMGNYALASAPYDLQGMIVTAYVSSADQVSIRIQNETGAPINMQAGIWNARVFS